MCDLDQPTVLPVETDITVADTLSDEELGRYLEDPDGFWADYDPEAAA